MKSFLNFSPHTRAQVKNWIEVFDEYYNDDGNLIIVSNETFTSDQDDDIPAFEYKYVINAFDMSPYGDIDNKIYIELWMVIPPENEDEIQELEECGVRFGYEVITYDTKDLKDEWYDYFYNLLDNDEVVEYLNTAATVLEFIDSTRGFYIDQSFNMIGTTGWDMLRSILLNENWLSTSINRIKGKTQNV